MVHLEALVGRYGAVIQAERSNVVARPARSASAGATQLAASTYLTCPIAPEPAIIDQLDPEHLLSGPDMLRVFHVES